MARVVIIGAGFAGLAALNTLAKSEADLEILLIDKKESFNFLPMLPDVLGRQINPAFLRYKISALTQKIKFTFVKDEVASIDFIRREVATYNAKLNFDYLIVASGSETNFYGQLDVEKQAYKLDDVDDARKISDAIKNQSFDSFIIAGGGYTGIEVATNLRRYLIKNGFDKKEVVIVERAPSILGPLPQSLKDYTLSNLNRLKIRVVLNSTIAKIEEGVVSLSNGDAFKHSLLIWAAGVKTGDFIQKLTLEKNPQGRLKVDAYLSIVNEHCYAVGDAANFEYKGKSLRMAVQFAIFQGRLAALNISRHIGGVPLKRYKPIDFGYLIPMANNRSCGIVLGMYTSGHLATLLHYLMCIYRSASFKNKMGVLANLLFK